MITTQIFSFRAIRSTRESTLVTADCSVIRGAWNLKNSAPRFPPTCTKIVPRYYTWRSIDDAGVFRIPNRNDASRKLKIRRRKGKSREAYKAARASANVDKGPRNWDTGLECSGITSANDACSSTFLRGRYLFTKVGANDFRYARRAYGKLSVQCTEWQR